MRPLFLSIIFLLPMLFSCVANKNNIVPSGTPSEAIDPAIRSKAQGSGSIKLLDHQLLPIDYLHKHPDQKGLLVNHYMGTGKTYLGIGFAESFPNRPVVILAPKFLQSHWQTQLKEYGVADLSRYQFVAYEDAYEKIGKIDMSEHILLADEVHNLVKYMRAMDSKTSDRYTQVYSNARNAYKILGLTGTPIYGDESDLAFVLNFVSGQDLMPFNQEAFRLQYTKVLPARQFFRGYLSESNLAISMFPIPLSVFFGAIFGPVAIAVAMPLAILLPVGLNLIFDLNTYRLRQLDIEEMRPIMRKYISYYRYDESQFVDFPGQDFQIMDVPYSRQQYSFFLRMVEGDLPVDQLQRLLKNQNVEKDDRFVQINSSRIHEQLYSSIGAGRDIGNFDFVDSQGQLIEPPKFLQIYEQLNKHKEATVIYSNYYKTGILAFRDFLLRQGYQEKFAIIDPDLPVDKVTSIVADYNRGDIKLLLLHPDITEGISLKGTQYLHILEPMLNSTVLEQVIGRTRRFLSHAHLPKDKQEVHVRIWQSSSSTWNPSLSDINRANWYKRYRELAYMSRWGIGISQVDKKIDRKALNPEELALLKLKTIEKNLGEMQKVLTRESIENLYR